MNSINILSRRDIQSQDFFTKCTKYQLRSCTDIICLIVGLAFSLIFIIVCFAVHNQGNYMKANFPADTDGQLCGIDYPGYSFIYFTFPSDITERVCVSKCPESKDTKLDCKSTNSRGCRFNQDPTYGVVYYPNQAVTGKHQVIDRSGSFCLPLQQNMRQNLIVNAKLSKKNVFQNSSDAIKLSVGISIIVAVLYFLLVQCFPKILNKYIHYVGCVLMLVILSTLYIKFKIFIGIIIVLLLVFVLLSVFMFTKSVDVNGIFLQQATKFVSQNSYILIKIPIFIGIYIGFAFLLVMELNSLQTVSPLNFDPSSGLYYENAQSGTIIGYVFLVIQAIWGFSFLKQSFNFIVSGYTILWYYGKVKENMFLPYKLYFTKHIGSVIAQSFMNGFFAILDTLFDLYQLKLPKNQSNYKSNWLAIFIPCSDFLDFVRSQSSAYIHLTGIPYCNSCRYCEYLHSKTQAMQNSQTASKAYRLSAYMTLLGIVGITALYAQDEISMIGLGQIIVPCYLVVNFSVQMPFWFYFCFTNSFQEGQIGNEKCLMLNREVFKSYAKGKGITTDIIKQLQRKNLFADQRVRRQAQCS